MLCYLNIGNKTSLATVNKFMIPVQKNAMISMINNLPIYMPLLGWKIIRNYFVFACIQGLTIRYWGEAAIAQYKFDSC